MSSTEEGKNITVAVEQAVKEKKTKLPKVKNPKTVSHPPYFQMIKEALLALKQKNGSSPYAISKFMELKYKSVLPENFKKTLALQLKSFTTKGKLTKVKASFKLSESGKKEATTKKPKSTKSKKPAARATATVIPKNKSAMEKKQKAKKMTPKRPKSIKSAAAKKAKKATV